MLSKKLVYVKQHVCEEYAHVFFCSKKDVNE